jgi:predicted small secreted protein
MKLLPAFTIMLFAFALSACNTISGAGEDIEAVGEAIEEAAENTKGKMT